MYGSTGGPSSANVCMFNGPVATWSVSMTPAPVAYAVDASGNLIMATANFPDGEGDQQAKLLMLSHVDGSVLWSVPFATNPQTLPSMLVLDSDGMAYTTSTLGYPSTTTTLTVWKVSTTTAVRVVSVVLSEPPVDLAITGLRQLVVMYDDSISLYVS